MNSLSKRFEGAALALAGSEGIKERLHTAWIRHLADLTVRDFPREVRDDFALLIDVLSRERALAGDTVLRASLRKLSNQQAAEFAALIIRTYGRIESLKSGETALLANAANSSMPLLIQTLTGSR